MTTEEIIKLKYVKRDSFHRPIFRGSDGYYYGSVNDLNSEPSDLDISDLVYFGSTFDCEPMGCPIAPPQYEIEG